MNLDLRNICDFIHELQKERGLTALYLSKVNSDSLDKLQEQFHIVDDLVKNVYSLKNYFDSKASSLLDSMNSLSLKRKLALAKEVEVFEMICFYSHNIISKAIGLVEEVTILDHKNDPAKVSAFIHFLKWKDRIGFERAAGIKLIEEKDHSQYLGLKERIGYIISEQQAYERMFLNLADNQIKDSICLVSKANETFKRIEKINESILKDSSCEEIKTTTLDEWFSLFTIKMDLLHRVGELIIANLHFSKESYDDSGCLLEASVRTYLDKIKETRLFSGIDKRSLYEVLKYARIIEYKKREKVFSQGDSVHRFYLVLEGFVKITKYGSDGKESIIQIIGNKDEILETSALINSGQFAVSAKAVENTKLLSIPASIIREKLKEDKDFASNALLVVTSYSLNIISQFGQVVAKDIKERVGWFLLKLSLDKFGLNKTFKLPYSKFLIANYLGMQPETFSRSLYSLKESGIDIERNIVSLSDLYALCSFCDSDTYSNCNLAGQDQCLSKNTWKA